MKVLNILGSPRKNGNSTTLAEAFAKAAESAGAEVSTVRLNDLEYRGCQACYVCKSKLDKCVLKDDLAPVLDEMHDADIIVLATPVYYGDITGQAKQFFDRTFSLLTPEFKTGPVRSRLSKGKSMVMITTQGEGEEMFTDIFERYKFMLGFYEYDSIHSIRGGGMLDADEASKNTALLKETEELAARLLKDTKLVADPS